jgi:radical SAM protein with 4Fe4S-binding SPASM domain
VKLISWNITKECNLSCRHCYRDAGEKSKGELTTREAKDLLCEIKKAGFNLVIFSGGEPLLRNDIYELINYANRLGLVSSLGTNGLLLSTKAAKKLKNLKLSSAGISIDSFNPDYHNRLRKSKDSWQRAMKAAKNCRDANLTFQIHTTLTKENYLDIPKFVYLSAKLGAHAHYFFFLVPCGRAVDINKEALSLYEHEHALRLILEARKKTRLYLRAVCAPQFVRFSYKGGDIQNMEKGCLAGREYCLIGPEGDVYPCPYLPLEIGNVRMTKFSKIWKENLIFNSLRGNNLKGRCARCEFAFYCRGCRANSFYYKEDIMEEDPKCSYQPDSYLDAFDKKLIGYLQEDFPLVLKPFKELAARLGLSEDEALFRASRLKSIGIIKRIGPIYNPEKLGFKRSLVAMSVPKEKLDEAANFINSFSEVTHNYLRDDSKFNLWFTLICPSHKKISSIIKDIRDRIGIKEIISLPTLKTIKVRAVFKTDGLRN